MGRTRHGVSDATALAELSVSFDHAIRATLPVAKDTVKVPILTLPSGSRGLNESAEKRGDAGPHVPCYPWQVGLVLLLAWREYRESAAGALRRTATGGE